MGEEWNGQVVLARESTETAQAAASKQAAEAKVAAEAAKKETKAAAIELTCEEHANKHETSLTRKEQEQG